jgi:phage RecT family recombinase
MAQASQQQQWPAQQPVNEAEAGRLLDQILEKAPSSKYRVINDALEKRVAKLEEVLPDAMKGQGRRLIKRAMMTFERNPDLQGCPPREFIRCVLEAAEIGLAIDGKLAYVVRYKNAWQMQPDYKGIIAVARRVKQIKDCYGDVVCENDTFYAYRENGKSHFKHQYQFGKPRGDVIGAYAIIKLPDGDWRYELMDRTELDRIQAISPAQSSDKVPWKKHPNEMRKKSVIRRAMKTYCDDPGVIRAIEFAEREFDEEDRGEPGGQPPSGRMHLRNGPPSRIVSREEDVPESRFSAEEQSEQDGDSSDNGPTETGQQGGQTEQPQEASDREGGLLDLIQECDQKIDEAKDVRDLLPVGQALDDSRAFLGGQYERLHDKMLAKHKDLTSASQTAGSKKGR